MTCVSVDELFDGYGDVWGFGRCLETRILRGIK